MTHLQILALKYAAGCDVPPPTYAVARRLEKRGLLRWAGGRRNDLRPMNESHRGWVLTKLGKYVREEG